MSRAGRALIAVAPAAIAVVLVAVPAAYAGKGHGGKAKPLSFEVFFGIDNAHYDSSTTANIGGCTFSQDETDNFSSTTGYHLDIPRKGPPSSTINEDGTNFATISDSGPVWKLSGHSPACGALPGGAFTCTGDLDGRSPAPQMLSGAGDAAKKLDLHVQSAQQLAVSGATGDYPSDLGGCDYFNQDYGLAPAAYTYMPDMLAAHIQVPLGKLRGLDKHRPGKGHGHHHRDDTYKVKVGSDKNVDQGAMPPFDCSTGSESCTQHLNWNGDVQFVRTK